MRFDFFLSFPLPFPFLPSCLLPPSFLPPFLPASPPSCPPSSLQHEAPAVPSPWTARQEVTLSLAVHAYHSVHHLSECLMALGPQMTVKVKDQKHESNWKHYLAEPVCLPGHLAVYKTWLLARKLIARGPRESTGLLLRTLHLLCAPNDGLDCSRS